MAQLFDVNESTVWRWWKQQRILVPPREFTPGVHGWTESEIAEFIETRKRMTAEGDDAQLP